MPAYPHAYSPYQYYTVNPGDTWATISAQTGVPMEQLMALNEGTITPVAGMPVKTASTMPGVNNTAAFGVMGTQAGSNLPPSTMGPSQPGLRLQSDMGPSQPGLRLSPSAGTPTAPTKPTAPQVSPGVFPGQPTPQMAAPKSATINYGVEGIPAPTDYINMARDIVYGSGPDMLTAADIEAMNNMSPSSQPISPLELQSFGYTPVFGPDGKISYQKDATTETTNHWLDDNYTEEEEAADEAARKHRQEEKGAGDKKKKWKGGGLNAQEVSGTWSFG